MQIRKNWRQKNYTTFEVSMFENSYVIEAKHHDFQLFALLCLCIKKICDTKIIDQKQCKSIFTGYLILIIIARVPISFFTNLGN